MRSRSLKGSRFFTWDDIRKASTERTLGANLRRSVKGMKRKKKRNVSGFE